jgi:hypothetical protein
MSTPQEISRKVHQDFRRNNANLLTCLASSPDETMQVVSAAASLDTDLCEILESLMKHMKNPDYQKHAEKMFYQTLYAWMAKELVNGYNNGILILQMRLTDLADLEFTELRYVASLEQRPAPVVQLSPEEQLEAEVISDFNGGLSAQKMRLKMNDKAYKACYDRLAETNRLVSQITQLHDGREIGG